MGWPGRISTALAVSMSLFHLYAAYAIVPTQELRYTHVAFTLILSFLLLSLVVVALPLVRVLPPLYDRRIRSRVFRWYAQLREVEDARGRRPAAELQHELDEIDAKVGRVKVPLAYADELYALRSHIQLVRKRVAS